MTAPAQKNETIRSELPARAAAPLSMPLRARPERRDAASRDRLVRRIEMEFREMPGLRVTLLQARRLFGIPGDACHRVLATLIASGVLRLTREGLYTLNTRQP